MTACLWISIEQSIQEDQSVCARWQLKLYAVLGKSLRSLNLATAAGRQLRGSQIFWIDIFRLCLLLGPVAVQWSRRSSPDEPHKPNPGSRPHDWSHPQDHARRGPPREGH